MIEKMKKAMILALLVGVVTFVSAGNKMATDYYEAGD